MWTELWIIFTAVLAGMIWTPALVAAPLIAVIYTLIRLIVEKRLPGPTPADLAILCLIILLPINYLITAIPEHTTSALFRLLGGIGLYFAVVHWCWTTSRLRWLVAITGVTALGS